MNFYQSDIRKKLTKEVYKKPTFQIEIAGRPYQGIVKTQRHLGKEMNRYMVHGIEGTDRKKKDKALEESLKQIQRDFKKGRGDIFFQCGFLDQIETFDVKSLKDDKTISERITKDREKLERKFLRNYNLLPSWREHMPDATVTIDINKPLDEIRKGYSRSGKRYINKAKKEDLTFSVALQKERGPFRENRYTMSYDKGFNILPKATFLDLMSFLETEKAGTLLVAKKGHQIVAGSVVVGFEKELVYLYGATDRSFGNIGAHYRLTDHILKRAKKEGYTSYDLLGVAPPGKEETHYLGGVTRFKQAFGGKEIVSIGNFDLVYNSLLYRGFQFRRGLKSGGGLPKKVNKAVAKKKN